MKRFPYSLFLIISLMGCASSPAPKQEEASPPRQVAEPSPPPEEQPCMNTSSEGQLQIRGVEGLCALSLQILSVEDRSVAQLNAVMEDGESVDVELIEGASIEPLAIVDLRGLAGPLPTQSGWEQPTHQATVLELQDPLIDLSMLEMPALLARVNQSDPNRYTFVFVLLPKYQAPYRILAVSAGGTGVHLREFGLFEDNEHGAVGVFVMEDRKPPAGSKGRPSHRGQRFVWDGHEYQLAQ